MKSNTCRRHHSKPVPERWPFVDVAILISPGMPSRPTAMWLPSPRGLQQGFRGFVGRTCLFQRDGEGWVGRFRRFCQDHGGQLRELKTEPTPAQETPQIPCPRLLPSTTQWGRVPEQGSGGRGPPGSLNREDEARRRRRLATRQPPPLRAGLAAGARASPTSWERRRRLLFSPPPRSGGGCPSRGSGGRGPPGSPNREDEARLVSRVSYLVSHVSVSCLVSRVSYLVLPYSSGS